MKNKYLLQQLPKQWSERLFIKQIVSVDVCSFPFVELFNVSGKATFDIACDGHESCESFYKFFF